MSPGKSRVKLCHFLSSFTEPPMGAPAPEAAASSPRITAPIRGCCPQHPKHSLPPLKGSKNGTGPGQGREALVPAGQWTCPVTVPLCAKEHYHIGCSVPSPEITASPLQLPVLSGSDPATQPGCPHQPLLREGTSLSSASPDGTAMPQIGQSWLTAGLGAPASPEISSKQAVANDNLHHRVMK